jgi:hypothetical protein
VSWHTSALVIEGHHAERGAQLLADLGLPGKQDVGAISGDQAGASDLQGRAIGLVRGWTVVWDPMMFIPDGLDDLEGMFETGIWSAAVEQALLTLSQRSRVYSFVVEGSSDSHGFAWYVSGRRRRLWLSQEGSVAMEEGPRLAEEAAATAEEPDGEQRMFVLMKALTGVSIGDADAASYRVFA